MSMKTEWVDRFEIKVKNVNGATVISANREGMMSLAKHLLALADGVPGDHIHYSKWSKTKKIKTQSVQSYYDNSWKKEAQKMSKEEGAWKTVHVDSNYLALRRSPTYDSSNEIGRLYNGDTVQITGNCSKSYVSVYSPKYNANGWVNAGFLR